jgi:pimeloyl-ACP methyl ester carboxylesterase
VESYQHQEMSFDVRDRGPADGDVVVLLHGFPQTSVSWDDVAGLLTDVGYRTLAPDQRGYSPGARPRGRRAYRGSELAGDVIGLLDAAGVERAHLVGHDWGGGVAWNVAMSHPDRVRTLTSLSTPHPAAFARALFTTSQLLHSWYMFLFQLPWLPEAAASPARNPQRFADGLVDQGVPADKARAYAELLAEPGAFTAALNWYRGAPLQRPGSPPGRVIMPTLHIHGARDRYVTRKAAELTARYVEGPYRLEILEDADHWLPDNNAERVVELLLPHLRGGER